MTATFDGDTLEKGDEPRLWSQLEAMKHLYQTRPLGEGWRTLANIRTNLKYLYSLTASEASISARLRDLRKERFGAYQVERKRIGSIYAYRVLPPLEDAQMELGV
jgi:hypothetical protein